MIGGAEMNDFRKHLEQSLRDPEFKAVWDAQAEERMLMRQIKRSCEADVLSDRDAGANVKRSIKAPKEE